MDKKKALLNISISLTTKIILLAFSLVLKRLLIDFVGNDANGVYSLYASILGFMSVMDLGIGTAISFSMYKPIVNGENEKVSALYQLYKKIYKVVALIVLVLGIAIMPLLPIFAKGYSDTLNLYFTFALMLASVLIEYLFSCKTSLINAYKNNYVSTLINSGSILFRRVIQLFVLIFAHSFELYLAAKIVSALLRWILVEIYTRKHYKEIISVNVSVDDDTKKDVVKHTYALFMHKIGNVLVNTTDNIIISAFIGVVLLGKYSNYLIIMTAMTSVLELFFTPLTSVIGHLCAEENIKKEKKYFKFMYFLNFTVGIIFYLGYYGVINSLVGLCFGTDLLLEKLVPMIITVNYFIQYMRQSVLLFRDATGTFYYDRWTPVFVGVINVILSITLVHVVGLVGVIVATIITNMLIVHIIEPYVLYKHGFKGESPKEYYFTNYCLIGVFVLCLFLLEICMQTNSILIVELIVNGFIAVGIALIPISLLLIFNKTYRTNTKKLLKKIKAIFKKSNDDQTINKTEIKIEPEAIVNGFYDTNIKGMTNCVITDNEDTGGQNGKR